MKAIKTVFDQRAEFIQDLNAEYSDEELSAALEMTKSIIAQVEQRTDMFFKEVVAVKI